MEPEQREEKPEEVASERAADATEETRRRRGEEGVDVTDEPVADEDRLDTDTAL